MRCARLGGGRQAARLVAVALLVGAATTVATPATADPASDDRSAQAQAVLDRVLGPGNSVVEIAATVRSSSGTTTKVAWGAALPAQVTASQTRAGAVSATSVTALKAVDRSSTTVVVPAGALMRQTVSVAVDKSALGSVPIGRLRHLVAAAVGLTPSRGDRLVLVATPFAKQPARAAATSSWTGALMSLAVPGVEVGGALIALIALVLALGGARRGEGGDLQGG